MRLPSSTSLLLSLAVSSSSSSLSALAAPTGDCPESSSPAPVPVKRDDTTVQPDSTSTGRTITTLSDTAIDHLQSRGLVEDVVALIPPPADDLFKKILGLKGNDKPQGYDKPPKARADSSSLPAGNVLQQAVPLTDKLIHPQMAKRAEESNPDEDSSTQPPPQDPSSPAAAAPSDSPQSPAATPSAPALPVKPPAPVPQLPDVKPPAGVPSPGGPVGRRDLGGVPAAPVVGSVLSPKLPRNPPNTPVPLPMPNLPFKLPGQ